VELIRFVHAFHHCDVIGHIRPNCFLLRQKSKFAPRTPSWKPSNPKTAHVCHHCGISRHTRMNCIKFHPQKQVSNVSRESRVGIIVVTLWVLSWIRLSVLVGLTLYYRRAH
jgi:hypothetical protein